MFLLLSRRTYWGAYKYDLYLNCLICLKSVFLSLSQIPLLDHFRLKLAKKKLYFKKGRLLALLVHNKNT
jgi:hypothetical protein